MRLFLFLFTTASLGWLPAALAQKKPLTGFHQEVAVEQPTRLDWEFAASGFGKKQSRLPAGYRSTNQRIQIYVPPTYDSSSPWPLIVFISPGDMPLGWRFWKQVCTEEKLLFCAAYGAGNRCPPGKRTRIVLDMLDQMRRQYRIDPQQTFLTGFSGGGRMACTIAFSLPEYFGGVIPVCGTNPLSSLDYLRHHVRDRLSVAFVTGEKDFNRAENEKYMAPLFTRLRIRSRLWIVKGMAHSVPGPGTLTEIMKWLQEDLDPRRKLVKDYPILSPMPDNRLTPTQQADRMLKAAEADLQNKKRIWRGVTLLQGILARWRNTRPADEAEVLLQKIQKDVKLLELVDEQGGKEEREALRAQAKSLENYGKVAVALRAWEALAKRHPKTDEGREAQKKVEELSDRLAATPYLGARFAGASNVVAEVLRESPAERGKLRSGDTIRKIGATAVRSVNDIRQALKQKKPGDMLPMEVERKGKRLNLSITLGRMPS